MRLNGDGRGLGGLATNSIWANWRPEDPVCVGCHGDLWARRARYKLHGPGLATEEIEMCGSDDAFYLLNIAADPLIADVSVYQADSRLYEGGFCWFPAGERLPSGRTSGRVVVSVPLAPVQLTQAAARPIEIKPYYAEAGGTPLRSDAARIELEGVGTGARLRNARAGD